MGINLGNGFAQFEKKLNLFWIKKFESLRWWVLKVSRAQLHEMPIKLGIITNWLNLEGAKMKGKEDR